MFPLIPSIVLIRPHHWIKNGFVLIPAFFGYQMTEPEKVTTALVLFAAFCLCSSAVYVFNDICDIEADRAHSTKRRRPLPAGDLTKTAAWIIFAALAAGVAAILAFQILNTLAVLMLGTYLAVNLFYSLGLKDFAVLEIFLVASGFVLRVIAGAVAIEVPFTDWILVCTGLLALLVVSGKRRADLTREGDGTKEAEIYSLNFLDHIISIFASVTVIYYVFFCFSEYATGKFGPLVLLTSVFVGFGIFRFVYLIMVRNVGDNPTLLVLKDNGMRITALCWTALFGYLIYFR